MKLLMFALAAALATPAAAPPAKYSGIYDEKNGIESIIPPPKYWGNTVTVVAFVDPDDIPKRCGAPKALACTLEAKYPGGPREIVYPNPCWLKAGHVEYIGGTLCHELGHVNGWPGTHGPN